MSSSSNPLSIPLGFFAAPVHESLHFHFDVNENCEQEMNFNDYMYYYSEDGCLGPEGSRKNVDISILRKIIDNPAKEQYRMEKMIMVKGETKIYPAHLPNFADVVMKPEVLYGIRQLDSEGPMIRYQGITHLISEAIQDVMDPVPVLPRSGPIYMLTPNGFEADFGCYTDKVQFVKVEREMTKINFFVYREQFVEDDQSSRYQGIKIRPNNVVGEDCFDVGTLIMLWNVRRITRPYFVNHFREVIATHNPVLVILSEVGAGPRNCFRVLEKLGTTMVWKVDSSGGFLGGTVVMWDPSRVKSSIHVADCPETDLRVVAVVTPNVN